MGSKLQFFMNYLKIGIPFFSINLIEIVHIILATELTEILIY